MFKNKIKVIKNPEFIYINGLLGINDFHAITLHLYMARTWKTTRNSLSN